ncbi:hypothetical protein, partial [Campylobacter troglodytis]|uniref:hypothetical protein n=1 Tax=Campylobacter troglodytis TaxID=654363 RepID=UPI00115BEA15
MIYRFLPPLGKINSFMPLLNQCYSLRIFTISLVSGILCGILVFISFAGIVQSAFLKSMYFYLVKTVLKWRF